MYFLSRNKNVVRVNLLLRYPAHFIFYWLWKNLLKRLRWFYYSKDQGVLGWKNWNISNPISHLNRMIFKLSQDVFKHSNEILLSLVYGEMEMYTYLSTSCMTQYAIKFTKVRDMILRVYAFGKRIQLKLFI